MRSFLLAAVLLGGVVKPAEVTGPLSIQVDVHPSARNEYELLKRPALDSYICSVKVTRADQTELLGSAHLIATAGEGMVVTNNQGKYGVEFMVTVVPHDTYNQAETRVTVRSGTEVVAQQTTTIALLHSTSPRNIPIH